MQFRRVVVVAASLSLATVGLAAPARAVVVTPAVPSALHSWGATGPVAGTAVGTLMGDGSVRPTASPASRILLTTSDRELVLSSSALTVGDRPPILADDHYLVGSRVTSTTPTARTATLWVLDPSTGLLWARNIPAQPVSVGLVGSTGSAWVTAGLTGPATLWPFDGGLPRLVDAPDLEHVVAAGDLGIMYLARGGDALASTPLRLAPSAGGAPVTITDFPMDLSRWTYLHVSTSGGAVAWTTEAYVGYWDVGTGQQRASLWWLQAGPQRVAVVPGAVTVLSLSRSAGADVGPYDRWATWTASSSGLAPAAGQGSMLGSPLDAWASATPVGSPAFGIVTGEGSYTEVPTTGWYTWVAGSDAVAATAVPQLSAAVVGAIGSAGYLLMTYQVSRSQLPDDSGLRVALSKIGGTSSTVVMADSRAASTGWRTPTSYGISGSRTAIPDHTSNGAQQLVLRTGARVTARVPLGVAGVSAVAMSGAYTLYSVASTPPSYVVRWADPHGGIHLVTRTGTTKIAQDGTLSAYQTTDGWVWLRDESAPPSRTNPAKIVRPGGATVATSTQHIWLSAGRLVVQFGSRLIVTQTATRSSRSIALGGRQCDQMSGLVLACRDLRTRQVLTLDTGARTLAFRPVSGISLPEPVAPLGAPTAFVGRMLATPMNADPRNGAVTTLRIGPLPTVNRILAPTRVLGPWSVTPIVSGNGRQCYAWDTQWSFTDPVRSLTLMLRDPRGHVVRVWRSSTADGWWRPSMWCPTTSSAAGTYRWTLTGTSAYGAVRNVTGTTTATGTVIVRHMYPAKVTIAIPTTARAGSTVTVTGRLLRADVVKPMARRTLTLWRSLSWTGWAKVGSGVTSSTGSVVWRVPISRTMLYQVRYEGAPDLESRASPRTLVTVRTG